jgi:anti-sigma factor RsiW
MHDIVANEFERHLTGEASREFYGHLAACAVCREEVAQLDDLSVALRELRPDTEAESTPPVGFYHRVADAIVERQLAQSWSFFSPSLFFFRRVAFASLLMLAGLGGYLVTRETSTDALDAATIMAQQTSGGEQPGAIDRDRLLVTLATYSGR